MLFVKTILMYLILLLLCLLLLLHHIVIIDKEFIHILMIFMNFQIFYIFYSHDTLQSTTSYKSAHLSNFAAFLCLVCTQGYQRLCECPAYYVDALHYGLVLSRVDAAAASAVAVVGALLSVCVPPPRAVAHYLACCADADACALFTRVVLRAAAAGRDELDALLDACALRGRGAALRAAAAACADNTRTRMQSVYLFVRAGCPHDAAHVAAETFADAIRLPPTDTTRGWSHRTLLGRSVGWFVD